MSIVFNLPFDLIHDLLNSWLEIVEWNKLDAAVNSKYRQYLLSVLCKLKCDTKQVSYKTLQKKQFYLWIKRRHIRLLALYIRPELWKTSSFQSLDLSSIKLLNFKYVVFNDLTVFHLIKLCKGLVELRLEQCISAFKDVITIEESKVKQLKIIEISWCKSTFCNFNNYVKHMNQLETLKLSTSTTEVNIDDQLCELIENNHNLVSIECEVFHCSGRIVEYVYRNCPHITKLIVHCRQIFNDAILNLIRNRKIEVLDVSNSISSHFCYHNYPVEDEMGVRKSIFLTDINCNNSEMTEILNEIMDGMERFRLYNCLISLELLEHLVQRCASTLSEFSVARCPFISVEILKNMLKYPFFKSLGLNNSMVEDNFCEIFSEEIYSHFTHLNVSGSDIQSSSIEVILQKCPNLQYFRLANCKNVIRKDVINLIESKSLSIRLFM